MPTISLFLPALLSLLLVTQESEESPCTPEPVRLGDTANVHRCDNLFLAGQFPADQIDLLRQQGIQRVITLRLEEELSWDEKEAVEKAELTFVSVPFRAPEELTDGVFNKVRALLRNRETKTILHCGSANRVGGVWLPYRVLDEGISLETALEQARQIGLRHKPYEEKALDYIRRRQELEAREPSAKPGVNDNFLDPKLDVDKYLDRFEVESREVYLARHTVVEACAIQPGTRIADIGAGTGLYSRLFAGATGPDGWVFAVDIAPRFLQHINQTAFEQELTNLSPLLCQENSVNLPPQSVDMAFVCDTYHHFEFPQSTLASLRRALRPGGRLIVIDFERIPGVTRQWLLDHVRAGKEVFRAEIEQAGFTFVEEIKISGFEENYFLVFQNP